MNNNKIEILLNYPFYNISFIKNYFLSNKINFKKSFGQNFIVDKNILKKYYNIFKQYFKGETVFEIGGGSGNLSWLLYDVVKKLYIFEIDNFFSEFLKTIFQKGNIYKLKLYTQEKDLKQNNNYLCDNKNYSDVSLFYDYFRNNFFKDKAVVLKGDFLDFEFKSLLKNNNNIDKVNIFGNIPYNISSLIIKKIAENKFLFNNIILTTQKEYFDRLNAIPSINGKEISFLTIFSRYHFKIKKLFDIKKNSFFPAPKINSTCFLLEPLNLFEKVLKKINDNIDKTDRLLPKIQDLLNNKLQSEKKIKNNIFNKVDDIKKNISYDKRNINKEEIKKIIETEFFKLISYCFSNKRKKVINSIKEYIHNKKILQEKQSISKIIKNIEIILDDENIRAERVDVEKWGEIFELIVCE